MLGSVFTFQLPCAIVLCILPASVELVDILLGFALDLVIGQIGVNYSQIMVSVEKSKTI